MSKKSSEETKRKIAMTQEKNKEEKKQSKKELVEKIKEEYKSNLPMTLKDKMEETTNQIVTLLKEKGEDKVNNIQIMSLIARKSLYDVVAPINTTYSPEEIGIAFNLYLEMINRINEIKKFPPTVESFANFMGISRTTYNNWLVDPDKKDVMDYIHSYLLGVLAVGGLTGETKEITSMFISKTMGKVEQITPIVVEHKKSVDIDTIQAQLKALKNDNIIEGEFEE